MQPASSTSRGEARTVTILFTDVAGSTELFTRLGEAAAERLRERHFGLIRGAVVSHGGREVKNLGDGLMTVFQSATDGVRAGVAIMRAIEEDNRRRRSDPVAVRIGISTGEASAWQGDFFGAPVVEASRLCARAAPGQILATETVRALVGERAGSGFASGGELDLKGLPTPTPSVQVLWEPEHQRGLRAVLADDAPLVREGLARLLEERGVEVIAQAADRDELLRCVARLGPDVVITDLRMPPTNTFEGLEAAEAIRASHPGVGVMVLSQYLESRCARRLLAGGSQGVGYMLKERVSDIDEFVESVRRVAAGRVEIDPELADPACES